MLSDMGLIRMVSGQLDVIESVKGPLKFRQYSKS